MADVQIVAESDSAQPWGPRRIVWAGEDTAYFFYMTPVVSPDVVYKKTTDGGATWGSPVTVFGTGAASGKLNIWADWWTSGDTGTLVHIVRFISNNRIQYINLNIFDDSLSLSRTAHSPTGTGATDYVNNQLDICKSRGGTLYVAAYQIISGADTLVFTASTDTGVNWTAKATSGLWESQAADRIIMQPGDAADDDDIFIIFWDHSADEIDRKNYDASANTWSTTNIVTGMLEGNTTTFAYACAHRHSDNKTILIAADDLITDYTIKCWEIGSGSITAKTDVETLLEGAGVAITMDQNNDDIYAIYGADPDETITVHNIYYKKSTDGGSTWGSKVQLNDATASDFRDCWQDPSVGGTLGGRVAPCWVSEDPSPDEYFINKVNSVTISGGALGAATPFGPVLHQQLAFLRN